MNRRERLGLALLHRLEPERAHELSLRALRAGLVPLPGPETSDRLRTRVAGMELPNPLGLAAGYDKNAVAVTPLMRAGFGFVEVGAATPEPQAGNPRPRLFRLPEDGAVVNRFGFNNDGAAAIARRLAARPEGVPVGLNIGAGKASADRAGDFAAVLRIAGSHADFVTVNVSSPNTERLRDLQGADALAALLGRVMAARPGALPVFVKVAPDLDDRSLGEVAAVAEAAGVAGLVATNTTVARYDLPGNPGSGTGALRLRSALAREAGGLSGVPLFALSTRALARLSRATGGRLPLIGVGGIGSGADAYAKIRAGASAVQLYTALVYGGLSLVRRILEELDALLARDGFGSVAEAVGTGRGLWLD